jgi:predicted HTH domain antitoxin
MPLVISDEWLADAGLDEQSARVEIACRLFDAGRLSLHAAGELAKLDRPAMESALIQRGLAVYRPTADDFLSDIKTLDRLGI